MLLFASPLLVGQGTAGPLNQGLHLAGGKPGEQARPPPAGATFDKPVRLTGGVGVKF